EIPFDPKLMRKFIAKAKSTRPKIPEQLARYIADRYGELRTEDERAINSSKSRKGRNITQSSCTTPRTLLAILRFATALARCRFSERVTESDVNEALRLIIVSKKSIYDEET